MSLLGGLASVTLCVALGREASFRTHTQLRFVECPFPKLRTQKREDVDFSYLLEQGQFATQAAMSCAFGSLACFVT